MFILWLLLCYVSGGQLHSIELSQVSNFKFYSHSDGGMGHILQNNNHFRFAVQSFFHEFFAYLGLLCHPTRYTSLIAKPWKMWLKYVKLNKSTHATLTSIRGQFKFHRCKELNESVRFSLCGLRSKVSYVFPSCGIGWCVN